FGLDLSLLYERDIGWAFLRVDVGYTRRVYGGQSYSEIVGIRWYEARWGYHRLNIPVFFGVKARLGESAAVYAAPGISYVNGVLSVKLDNIGDIPTTLLGASGTVFGTVQALDLNGRQVGGAVVNEHAVFRARGPGLNFLIGVEARMDAGRRFFVE